MGCASTYKAWVGAFWTGLRPTADKQIDLENPHGEWEMNCIYMEYVHIFKSTYFVFID